jgi:hypothetical protein
MEPFGAKVKYSAQKWLILKAGGSNSVVESQPSKLLVAGSIPVSRSMISITCGNNQNPIPQNTALVYP